MYRGFYRGLDARVEGEDIAVKVGREEALLPPHVVELWIVKLKYALDQIAEERAESNGQ